MRSVHSLLLLQSIILSCLAYLIHAKEREEGRIGLRNLQAAISSVISQHRNLQNLDIDLASCLSATTTLVNPDDPGGIAAVFSPEDVDCLSGQNFFCDLDGTDYSFFTELRCSLAGGVLIKDNVSLCREDLGTPDDVMLLNVPVCLAPSCASDTTYRELLNTVREVAEFDGDTVFPDTYFPDFSSTLSGSCAPIQIEWSTPRGSESYEDRTATVGDTVVFLYGNAHDVYIHPSGTCSRQNRISVGLSGPIAFTFPPSFSGSTVTFASDIGNQCQEGQIITFTVLGPTPSPSVGSPPTPDPTYLPVDDFKDGVDTGIYDVIMDTRSRSEWDLGHIEGATFVENLYTFGTLAHEGADPSDFSGCELCEIVVYSSSKSRAILAIRALVDSGFEGMLYNGGDVRRWEDAGYPLVTDDSVVPPCSLPGGGCISPSPSDFPSSTPTLLPTALPSKSPTRFPTPPPTRPPTPPPTRPPTPPPTSPPTTLRPTPPPTPPPTRPPTIPPTSASPAAAPSRLPSEPTARPTLPPFPLFNRKIPDGIDKAGFKLKRDGIFTGIRGGARQLSPSSPIEKKQSRGSDEMRP